MIRDNIVSKNSNFIGCWKIDDEKLFNDLIDFFEKNKHLQKRGVVGSSYNSEKKKTTDITIDPNSLKNKSFSIFNIYFEQLFKCYTDYRKQ